MLKNALTLASHGLAVHWLHPKSKRPIGNKWAEQPVASAEKLQRTYGNGNNLGVRTGKWSKVDDLYLHIIDIDIRSAEFKDAAWKKLHELLPELDAATTAIVVSGSGGESRHVYILTNKPFPPRKFAHSPSFKMVWDDAKQRDVKKWDWELHLLGTGAQAAIPPSIHPDTGNPYVWEREFDWDDVALGLIDAIPAEAIERLIGYEDGDSADLDPERMKPLGMTVEQVRDTLETLPVEDWFEDRDGWFRTGMAVHHETSGSKEGFDLWCEFSKRSPKFDLKDSKRVWNSFGKRDGKPFRMASLNAVANDIRLMNDIEDYGDDLGEGEESEFEDYGDEPEDDDDDLLGSPKKPTRSQVKLAKSEVESALGKSAPSFVKRLNEKFGIAIVSGKTVVLHFKSDGRVYYGTVNDLHTYHENDRKPKDDTTVPVSKLWIQHKSRRTYPEGIIFAPNREVEGAYNHWQGFSVEPSEAKDPSRGCKLFLKHLFEVVCDCNEEYYRYHLGWLAHMIQRPDDKPGVAVVYKGKKRIGKDTVFEYMGELFKNHYVTVANQDHMVGKFNQHQEKCLLLHVQEGFWAGNKQAESSLKYLITSRQVTIEPKGVNAFQVPSVLRLFISSNERWVIPATEDEGRFFVLNVSEKRRNDHAYFAALRHEMEGEGPSALLAYLMQYDLSGFQVRKVPDTEALAEQKEMGLKNIERWWLDTLHRGHIDGIQNRENGVDCAIWWETSVRMDKSEFRENYNNWMRGRRFDGEQLSEIEFGFRMKRLCPSAVSKQVMRNRQRLMVYSLPSLLECREEFEAFIGSKIAWNDIQQTVEQEEEDDLG